MKRFIVTFNWSRGSRKWRQLLVTGRTFVMLSISSMAFFVAIGIGDMIHQRTAASPGSTMKGVAANVSGTLFTDMLKMEVAAYTPEHEGERALAPKQVGRFLLRLVTDVNPNEPRSLLARELPGISSDEPFLIRSGSGNETAIGPEDHPPIPGSAGSESSGMNGMTPGTDSSGEHSGENPSRSSHESAVGDNEGQPGAAGQEGAQPGDGGHQAAPPNRASQTDEPVVFIYHSHNRESWFPVIGSDGDDPTSAKQNITLVGQRLADKLMELGLGAETSKTDYPTEIKNYKWALSYKYSRKTVEEALAARTKLKFIFDIHRDSQKRKYTTTTIGGKSYAQVYFIIGQENPNWRKNEKLATDIHKALEAEYPGISRGVWGKTSKDGNGEYNQSLSPGSVLIEIGGVDNTLEESYRTADALAKVIADLYWGDAEQAAAPRES
ncbi:stage II sporulation protein P [Paenibacillus xylaniclasticus]|uniref:stage II sporulation protein P n=1 Tax=Paenibacillus xylaniclasticus TaxID=588083 RepID=UPI000FDBFF47|nr:MULTISPECIES: stage II sporulation protein P [Paenibacillus]GFN30306.1 stage II sporulation protein P [Paenibacillus curdlanolyticus]